MVEGGPALQVTGAGPEDSLMGQEDIGDLMLVGNSQLALELQGYLQSSQSFGLVWESRLAGQSDLALTLGLAASFR